MEQGVGNLSTLMGEAYDNSERQRWLRDNPPPSVDDLWKDFFKRLSEACIAAAAISTTRRVHMIILSVNCRTFVRVDETPVYVTGDMLRAQWGNQKPDFTEHVMSVIETSMTKLCREHINSFLLTQGFKRVEWEASEFTVYF